MIYFLNIIKYRIVNIIYKTLNPNCQFYYYCIFCVSLKLKQHSKVNEKFPSIQHEINLSLLLWKLNIKTNQQLLFQLSDQHFQ